MIRTTRNARTPKRTASPAPKRLLLAGAHEDIADPMKALPNYHVSHAINGPDILALAAAQLFDIVLIDVQLADIDGREVCRALRAQHIHWPIVLLSELDAEIDVILGLDAGADDYIIKPCSFPVLLARLRAQSRAHERSRDAHFSVGPYDFHPAQRLLVHNQNNVHIPLTARETELLTYLCRQPDRVAAKDKLHVDVWQYGPNVVTNTIETHVYRLRRKIEPDPISPRVLFTEPAGYRLAD